MDGEAEQPVGSPVRARYSVSFQEHFTEVTPLLGANEALSQSSLVFENESSCMDDGDNDPLTKNELKPRSFSVSIPSYGAVCVKKDRRRIKSYSFSDAKTDYQSTDCKKSTMVLCCHGKEFGKCCADLENGLSLSTRTNVESEHCHVFNYTPVDRAARKRLITASILCLVFMIGEVIGGYLAGSLAIMTDAAHLLTDFASFMISLFSLWVAARPATKRMSFGWYRAEVIGALTSVLLIWVVTGVLLYMAIERIISQSYEIDAVIMLITSGVGVIVNILMGVILYCQGGSHGHSHGGISHSHLTENKEGVAKDNINVRAAFIHVIGDFLQSIGVFVAALIIFFQPSWGITDPICTFLFSVVVLITTISILRDVLTVLMEGIPRGIDFNDVQKTFLSIDGVIKVHNLRIWSLSMDKIALAAHIAINPGIDPKEILKETSRIIRSKYNFLEMTLQIEDYIEEMRDCSQCKCPED